jgi:hypothetical protein
MRTWIGVLGLLILVSCASAPDKGLETLLPRKWSVPVEGLSVKLQLDENEAAAGGMIHPRLFLRASDPGMRHAKLLQGQFVYTFAPLGRGGGHEAYSTRHHFSGGGGLDYSGRTAITNEVRAPSRKGTFLLIATVLSSREDIQAFLVLARMKAGAGPWWMGSMSTAPLLVEVVE